MNTTLTLNEIMNCLGADILPDFVPMDKNPCWIAPVEFLPDGAPIVPQPDVKLGMDIYALMGNSGTALAEKHEALAFYTVGWAAPNDGDDGKTAPSEHPNRCRVALLCFATKDGQFGSAMRLYGNPDQQEMLIQDDGEGMLKDCALAMWGEYK